MLPDALLRPDRAGENRLRRSFALPRRGEPRFRRSFALPRRGEPRLRRSFALPRLSPYRPVTFYLSDE
jgi:hypothetical protein